jgi:2-polyprenyl-6-methoxyphenol hydroxylase-like FAD-dependent oxidoreductase
MDRNWLNERLLSEADELKNVEVVFEHKLLKCDVSKGNLTFLYKGKEKIVTVDVIIGADGVYSQVRTGMMKNIKYVPLLIANENGFLAELHRLRMVWTRDSFCGYTNGMGRI